MTAPVADTVLRQLGVSPGDTVAVVAPHPDDEVFALGGTMALLEAAGVHVRVIAVTDGEASHASSLLISADRLAELRCSESERAYAALGIAPRRRRLRLPDGGLPSDRLCLPGRLAAAMTDAALCLAPLPGDGHPDHDACASAAAQAAEKLGIPLLTYAVWAYQRPGGLDAANGRTPIPIGLEPGLAERKARAMRAYESQLQALGPLPEDGPVLPPGFLAAFETGVETVWR